MAPIGTNPPDHQEWRSALLEPLGGIRYAEAMIGRLRGELVRKQPGLALVECGGVGYECSISLSTYGALPEEGQPAVLHVETLLRENDLSLLGFATLAERTTYRLLVKVDGVGPKLALAALGALPLEDLAHAHPQQGREMPHADSRASGRRRPRNSASSFRKSSAASPGWTASGPPRPPRMPGRTTCAPPSPTWGSRRTPCSRSSPS